MTIYSHSFYTPLYNLHWYKRPPKQDIKILTATEDEESISVPVTRESFRFKCEWILAVPSCNHGQGCHCVSLHLVQCFRRNDCFQRPVDICDGEGRVFGICLWQKSEPAPEVRSTNIQGGTSAVLRYTRRGSQCQPKPSRFRGKLTHNANDGISS
ncbi:hypothetical protein BDR04DRAFT_830734 [Suillus decipiens]|nr:hypothetical protein BDR04DRAFT_830734 [Suillus decipiens]